jgi:cellulose synthase/poly-beta-1,6-N-acetylglucosamine synthase-like glycosyltransferase
MGDHENVFFLVVFSVYAFAAAIQLFYYLFFYLSVHTNKPDRKITGRQPVSVIICARDEAENLTNFLPSVLKQDFPDYEVIVVNDCSEDNSGDILKKFQEQYTNLRVSTVIKDPMFTHNKKFAQFIGIKAARNDILLFTDADCHPVSAKWIETISSHFDEKTSFVLGYGGYLTGKGLLNKYIRYDSLTIAMQYLSMAIRGIPYMGVGRNLAYRRSVFFEKKGFGSHMHLKSGDDDLFVNANANGNNTRVEFSPESHTRSVPAKTISDWVMQKQRHLSTAPYYKLRDKFLLLAETLSRVIFYISLVVLLSFTYLWPYVLALCGVRLVIQIIIYSLVQKKLNEPGLVSYSLFFDIFSPVINSVVFLISNRNRSGKNKWK